MRTVFHAITKPFAVLILIFLFQFSVYQYITLMPYINGPKDKTFNPITSYDIGHITVIRQAKSGYWTYQVNRTTAPTPRVYAYPLSIILGKIAALTRMDPQDMYFVSKIIGAAIVFVAVYAVVVRFFPLNMQSIALLLALGIDVGPWVTTLFSPGAWDASLFSQSAVVRHFGLPHHTIGEASALVFFLAYYRCFWSWNVKSGIALFFLGVLASAVLLPYMMVLFIVCSVSFGVIALMRRRFRTYILTTGTSVASVAVPALFYRYQFSLGQPWNNFYNAEKLWYPTSEIIMRYLSSLIFYIPFILLFALFVPVVWRRFSRNIQEISIVGVVWLVAPLAVVPILPYTPLPLANFRIIDTYVYVFPGIVSAIGWLAFRMAGGMKRVRSVVATVVFVGVWSSSLWATYMYTQSYVAKRSLQWANIYIANDVWQAIRFFSTVPEDSGVLALQHFGDILADQASIRVYVGLTPGYTDWEERVERAKEFYSGLLPTEQAHAFLTENDISYVFYGPMELLVTKKPPLYPGILTPVFRNGGATIFAVQKKRSD